jgi:hypothetical protein
MSDQEGRRRPILIFDAVAVTAHSPFVCLYSFPSAGPKCHPWQGGSYMVARQIEIGAHERDGGRGRGILESIQWASNPMDRPV